MSGFRVRGGVWGLGMRSGFRVSRLGFRFMVVDDWESGVDSEQNLVPHGADEW